MHLCLFCNSRSLCLHSGLKYFAEWPSTISTSSHSVTQRVFPGRAGEPWGISLQLTVFTFRNRLTITSTPTVTSVSGNAEKKGKISAIYLNSQDFSNFTAFINEWKQKQMSFIFSIHLCPFALLLMNGLHPVVIYSVADDTAHWVQVWNHAVTQPHVTYVMTQRRISMTSQSSKRTLCNMSQMTMATKTLTSGLLLLV